jgi:hypothetical protein
MSGDNHDYYLLRMAEEKLRSQRESDPNVRHVHETMANLYRIRLEGEQRGDAP